MTPPDRRSASAQWFAAAGALLQALEAENHALLTLDLNRITELLGAKQLAVAAAVNARAGLGALAAQDQAAARALTTRLAGAAADNRRLLERAMAVQRRVIATVAKAAKAAAPAASRAPRYGARGSIVANAAAPIAHLSNA